MDYKKEAEELVSEHGAALCDLDNCEEDNLCESCREYADGIVALLEQTARKARESAIEEVALMFDKRRDECYQSLRLSLTATEVSIHEGQMNYWERFVTAIRGLKSAPPVAHTNQSEGGK